MNDTPPTSRLERAREDIGQRQALAELAAAEKTWWVNDPTTYDGMGDDECAHIAVNDPAHVLRVLAAAADVLRRHVPVPDRWPGAKSGDLDCSAGEGWWPCPEALAVLAVYAPESQR